MTKLFSLTVALMALAGTANAQDCSCNRIGSTSSHGYLYLDGGTDLYPTSILRTVKWQNNNAHIDVMDGKNLYFNYYAGGHVLFGNANGGAHSVIKKDGTIGIGTSNPLHAFHFVKNQDARTRLLVENTNTGASQEASITIQSNGTAVDFITYGLGVTGNMSGLPKKNSAFIRTHTGSPAERLVVATGSASPIQFAPNDQVKMTILPTGQVGIGTSSPDEKLTVKGVVHAQEVKVDLNVPGPDYVFEADYNLLSLKETKAYLQQYKHLPEIPSAVDLAANGISVGEMNMLLLKKIEELTLHQIELMELLEEQKQRIQVLERHKQEP